MIEGEFFRDIAVLTALAGFAAVLFSHFGWPKVLGYIAVGILMSPHTWGGSFLVNPMSTQVFGQLGVIFLMFGMGLSFSAREMRAIRSVSVPCAVIDVVVMVWIGYTLGVKAFGWSEVQSLFLGVAICDSATTFLAKVFDELGWQDRPFVKYVLGTSVCEDIICVGAIAVATGVAKGGGMSMSAFAASIGWLAVFFMSMLVFGFVALPRMLKSVAKWNDSEALVLLVLGVLFFVSFIAYRFEFSLALGAFIVGVVVSQSDVRKRLAELMDPLKSLFAAVFFVSIGLLVNPAAIWSAFPKCLLVTVIVVVGKFVNVFVGSLVTGQGIRSSVQSALALAQIGEFAFMVAILYANIVGDSGNEIFQIAVGASLATTLLNPLMIRLSGPAADLAEALLPEKVENALATYRSWLEKLKSSEDAPSLKIIKAAFVRLSVYAVLILSISIACSQLPLIDYTEFSVFFERHNEIIFFAIANVLSLGFTPLLLPPARAIADEVAALIVGDGIQRWQLGLKQSIRFFVFATILFMYLVELIMIDISLAPRGGYLTLAVVAVSTLSVALGWKFFHKAGKRATQRFLETLTAEERHEAIVATTTISVPEGIIHRFTLDSASPAIGGTVVSLNIRSRTGASVVSVHRDGVVVRNVGPDWIFAVGDTLVAIGEPPQIAALEGLLGVKRR